MCRQEIALIPPCFDTFLGVQEVKVDEFPRAGCTIEGLKKLRAAFITDGTGTVTAGNASGINDGAGAVVLMPGKLVKDQGLSPMAGIVSWAQTGVDPAVMGTGPISATRKAVRIFMV